MLAAASAAGVAGVLLYAAVRPRDPSFGAAARTESGQGRGEAIYPALPPMPAPKARPPRRPSAHAAAAPNAAEILDLSLRRIAAETSVLELAYRPFAEACLAAARDASSSGASSPADGDWLGPLKTARLRSGVTLRDKGATVGCDTARMSLVARADALKSELDAAENAARTSGVLPAQWRTLLGRHQLEVWDRY